MYVVLLPQNASGTLLIGFHNQAFAMAAESMPFFSRIRKHSPRYDQACRLFPRTCSLTAKTVGHYHGDILQCRHHNHQTLDLATLSPTVPTPSFKTPSLDCRRLRHKLLDIHYSTDHLSMPTHSSSLGCISEGPLPQVERGLHRFGHMQYDH